MEGGDGEGSWHVCVTGASGYLGSWLVMRLLQRGYSVRGTVRNLDKSKVDHLLSLPEAKEKLELVQADLLDESSLHAAVKGCDGVFAVAVPLIDPRLDQIPHKEGEAPFLIDESWWTSEEYCRQKKMLCWGYMVAKTLSEKAAFEYGKDNNLNIVSILPSLVGGPWLTPSIPDSVSLFLATMTEVQTWMNSLLGYMSYVHVDDTIRAHILLMENPHAEGRYLCSAVDATLTDVLHELTPLLTSCNILPPKVISPLDKDSSRAYYNINTNKLKDLGFSYEYDTMHKIFKDALLNFCKKGYLKELQQELHS